ncbi:Calx-beta domain-containing protein, partial [Tenacibaculum sp. 1_MG-2023]
MGKIYNQNIVTKKWSKMVSLLLIVFAFSFTTQTVFSQNAALIVNTTTEDGNDTANDVVNYIATIRNTGDVALNSVSLTSNLAGLTLTVDEDGNGDAVLDVGEAWTYIGSYTNAAGTSVSSTFSLTSAEITTPITYSHTEAVHEDDYATAVIKVLPFLKLDDITVTEGDNPVAMVPVSISHPSTEAIDVQITQTNGSAVDSDDYTETTITVTIPAGQTSITVDIPITNDNIGESTESFTVNGTSSSTCPATPSTVTILDDDTPVVILEDVTVTEGTDPVATIPVSISNPSDETIVVQITQTIGTAGTDDYTVETIEVTFLAGETSTTVDIDIEDDLLLENTETFSVNGTVTSSNATNATPSIVTILDNDINAIVIGSVIVTEGTDAVATVPVSITNPSVLPTVITITQTIGTAGTDDYTSATITVTIPAGATTTTVDIPITNDNIYEATESFTVNGTSPTATSGAPGIVTILEDPTDVPALTIGDDTVTEGDAISIPVTLSNP